MDKEKDEKGQEKTYDQKHVDGMTKDLQGEREKRQEAEFQLSQSKRDFETLKQTVEDLKEKSKKTTEPGLEINLEGKDDDYATVKDVRLGFKSLEKDAEARSKTAIKAAKDAAKAEQLQENFDKSCQLAIEKYFSRKSIGLDFETVYKAAIKRIGRNTYEEAAILHSANPGERLYKIGSEDPDIKAKLDLEENQEILNIMDSRKVDKESLTGVPIKKDDEFFTPQEIINMTPLEAQKVLPKIEKSMEHWKQLKKQKK